MLTVDQANKILSVLKELEPATRCHDGWQGSLDRAKKLIVQAVEPKKYECPVACFGTLKIIRSGTGFDMMLNDGSEDTDFDIHLYDVEFETFAKIVNKALADKKSEC